MTHSEANLDLIASVGRAAMLLQPLRLRILAELRAPGSATGLARRLRLPRQRVNYHVRQLARAGYLRRAGRRRKRNMIEQHYVATARAYVLDPALLGALAVDLETVRERFSATYLVAVSAQAIRDVATLRTRAEKEGKKLATFTLQSEVRFATAQDRSAFAEELTREIARLAAKYHNEAAPGGRAFRFFIGGYPKLTKQSESEKEKEP